MRELKCPNCHQTFQVDADMFESIANQVRSAVIEDEVAARVKVLADNIEAKAEERRLKSEMALRKSIADREKEIVGYNAEIDRLKADLDTVKKANKAETEVAVARCKSELEVKIAERDSCITGLRAELKGSDDRTRLALAEQASREAETLRQRDQRIAELQNDVTVERTQAKLRETSLREQHTALLRAKDAEIEYYKDLKARMSTKMIGESLEIHCATLFDQSRAVSYPSAYFEKDNDAREGSKGDFIFRDYIDGVEYISIMFEMKNEADTTATKHRNEDFFKKLDADRRAKNCEYAVLVSLLEPDSELYNAGIVDVSHRYDKMFVVRPQFFMSIIALLSKASRNAARYKLEAEQARKQSVDVTDFERKLDEFRTGFANNYRLASAKFQTAITEIDNAIARLTKVREALLSSENNLRLANDKADRLTIRKLTYNNPTMKAAFAAARDAGDDSAGTHTDS